MINFIICSSNYSSRKETKEIIDSYMMNYDIEVKYHLFNNNKEELRKIHGYKVYLIEIDNNPYDLVKHIREELDDWNSIIILLAENRGIESILGTRLFLFDVIPKIFILVLYLLLVRFEKKSNEQYSDVELS